MMRSLLEDLLDAVLTTKCDRLFFVKERGKALLMTERMLYPISDSSGRVGFTLEFSIVCIHDREVSRQKLRSGNPFYPTSYRESSQADRDRPSLPIAMS